MGLNKELFEKTYGTLGEQAKVQSKKKNIRYASSFNQEKDEFGEEPLFPMGSMKIKEDNSLTKRNLRLTNPAYEPKSMAERVKLAREYAEQMTKPIQDEMDGEKTKPTNSSDRNTTASAESVIFNTFFPYGNNKKEQHREEKANRFKSYNELKNNEDFLEFSEKGRKSPARFLDILSSYDSKRRVEELKTMTDEEQDVYYYLMGKYGANAAKEYASSELDRKLSERFTNNEIEEAKKFGEQHPIMGIGTNAIENIQGSSAYLQALLKKPGNDVDLNKGAFTDYKVAQATQEGIKNAARNTFGENGAVDFLTDTGLSITQNLARLPMGKAGLAIAGLGSATGGYLDARNKDGTEGQALASGAAQGIAEAFFEKFSLEGLRGLKTTPVYGARDFIKNLARQGITEGSEEMATELANTLSDRAIMGKQSDYDIAYQNYIDAGYSEKEARVRANIDSMQKIGLAGLGGALSGGIMGGGAMALNGANTAAAGKQAYYTDGHTFEDIAGGFDMDSENISPTQQLAYDFAKQFAEMEESGKHVSNYQRGLLENALYQLEAENPGSMPEMLRKAEPETKENPEIPESNQKAEEPQNPVEETTVANEEIIVPNEETAVPDEETTAPDEEITVPNEKIAVPVEENHWDTQTESRQEHTGETEQLENQEQPDYEYEQKGTTDGRMEKGNEPSDFITSAGDEETAKRQQTQDVAQYGKQFGSNGTEAYVNTYDGSVGMSDYHKAFGRYYDAGRYNVPLELADRAAIASLITPEQASAAYKAGALDRNASKAVSYRQGEVKQGGLETAIENATEAHRKVAETLGKKTGLKFVLTDDENFNGVYNREKGTIYLSTNADNFLSVASHELTHFIQDYSPKLYRHYQDTTVKAMMESQSISLEELINQYESKYSSLGKEVSREEIMDEIAADATGKFLNDEEFIDEIAHDSEKKSIGYKILDFINDMIDSIKNLISNSGIRKSARALEEQLDYYESAREMWVNALDEAGEVYKSGKEVNLSGEKYQLNEFGFDEYTEQEKENWGNSNIIFCNTETDIINYVEDSLKTHKYSRMYIGKIGGSLSEKIEQATGIKLEGYNVALSSDNIRKIIKDHGADNEALRGQVPVTAKELAKIPEIISDSDKISLSGTTEKGKTALRFEKNIDGHSVVIEYVSDKRKMLYTQTMYINKKNRSLPTAPDEQASAIRPKTRSGIAPDNTIPQIDSNDNLNHRGKDENTTQEHKKRSLVPTTNASNETRVTTSETARETASVSTIPQTDSKNNLKYQLKDVDNNSNVDLIAENENLKKANEYLTRQLTLTKDYEPRKADIVKVSAELLKKYNSTYNRSTLESNLSKLYSYIHNAQQVDGREVTEAAAAIGKGILRQAVQKDSELTEQYKDVLDKLKNTKISISKNDRASLDSEGGYEEFRRRNFRKIRFSNDGIDIDSIYQELSSQYPELFPEEITHPADQAIQMADTVEMLQPRVENPYHASMDEMAYLVGQEILDSFSDVRNLPPTKMDRMAAEVDKVRRQYAKQVAEYKEKLRIGYNEKLQETRKENVKKIEELREKSKNAKGEQQEYYLEQIKKLRDDRNQKLAAQSKRYQDSIKKRRENHVAYEKREQITKNVLKMKTWLLNPNDKKYIPEAFRGKVANFLESIDFSTDYKGKDDKPAYRTIVWNEVKDIYKEIADNEGNMSSENESVYMDVDPDLVAKIGGLVEKVKGIDRLVELDSHSLEELSDVVQSMMYSIRDVNKLKANQKFQKVEDVASKFMEENGKRKEKIEGIGVGQLMDDMLKNGMLDARTYFGRLGPAASSLYDSLRAAFDKKVRNTKTAQDYMQELMKKNDVTAKDIKEWSGRHVKATAFQVSGGTVKLTPAQVMSLYDLNKRKQAQGHIYSKTGGIKQAETILKKKTKMGITSWYKEKSYHPVQVTPEDVNMIISTLSEKQKAIADGIMYFLENQTSEWGNEVTMSMYGYKKFNAKNYFPIVSDDNYIDKKEGKAIDTLKNMGATKATTPHANNPIIIEDVFDVYTRHADQMGSYNAFVEPLSDLRKFYNYKAANRAGSVQEELERTFGKAGQGYIQNLMEDINGLSRKEKSIAVPLVSNMKAAAVGANLRVVIQQPTAYARAAAAMDVKYLAKGLATIPRKGQWETVKQYAPIAQWKDWGYFSLDTGKSMKNIFMGTESRVEQLRELSMWGAGKADEWAWNRLWSAAEAETRAETDLEPGTEEFYEHVGKRFSEVVDRTQVVDTVLHRTRIMREKDLLTKMATSFMSEPMKTYNMLYESIADASLEKTQESYARVGKVAVVWTVTSALTALAASLVDMFRDDDEEKNYKQKYGTAFLENMFFDNMNPAGFIPYVKELFSIASGYEPKRTEMTWAVDISNSAKKWIAYKQGKSPYTIPYLVSDSVKSISKLTGLPIANVKRTIDNSVMAAINIAGLDEAEYSATQLKLNIKSDKNITAYSSLILKALYNGNQELAEKIYNDMEKAGISTDDIDERMQKKLKDNPLIQEAAEARMERKYEDYEDIIQELTELGIEKEMIVKAVDSQIRKIEGDAEEDEEENESEDEEENEEKAEKGVYRGKDLIYAIEAEDKDSFTKVANELYDAALKAGKTETQAIGNIKRSITSKYKKQYLEAADNSERLKILGKIKYLKIKGKAIYSTEDFENWFDEWKETQKKKK